jgi:DNA-directed RNA polymerase specialized sigma24 family protein
MDLNQLVDEIGRIVTMEGRESPSLGTLAEDLRARLFAMAGSYTRHPEVRQDAAEDVAIWLLDHLENLGEAIEFPLTFLGSRLRWRVMDALERAKASGDVPARPGSQAEEEYLDQLYHQQKREFSRFVGISQLRYPAAVDISPSIDQILRLFPPAEGTLSALVGEQWPDLKEESEENAASRLHEAHAQAREHLADSVDRTDAYSLEDKAELRRLCLLLRRRPPNKNLGKENDVSAEMLRKLRYPHRGPSGVRGGEVWVSIDLPPLLGDIEVADPGTLRVDIGRLLRLQKGRLEEDGRWWILRGEGRILLSQNSSDYIVIENTDEEIRWAILAHSEPIPMPPVERWLGTAGVIGWMAEELRRLAYSALPLDRLGAAGLLCRLWGVPRDRPGGLAPSPAVREWLQSLTGLSAQEDVALGEVKLLREILSQFVPFSQLRWLRLERDRLASVLYALRMVRQGERLQGALQEVDRLAGLSASTLVLPARADDPDMERWRTARWQEPEAWWVDPR